MAIIFVIAFNSAPHNSRKPALPVAVTISTDHPSEATIPNTYRSTATGQQPKYLRLPTIHAQGFVQAVGIDQHHQVAVPTNINLAGWFADTVTPGEPGLSIVDGHLDGRQRPGIFANLAQLKQGDTFSVDLANGVTHQFRVLSVQSLPTDESAAVLFSQAPGVTNQLNLITCGGTFKQAAGYDHRVVVTASLLN
jgi:LPXTG-site transpeptidase (sortase) family protein